MVGRPPTNAGDTGLTPGLGVSHMQAKQLSLCAPTAERQCHSCRGPWALEPRLYSRRSHCNERPTHCSWRVATPTPAPGHERKPTHSNEDPARPKRNKNLKNKDLSERMIMNLKIRFQAKETKQKQVNKKSRTQENVGLNHVGEKAQTHSSECKKKLS